MSSHAGMHIVTSFCGALIVAVTSLVCITNFPSCLCCWHKLSWRAVTTLRLPCFVWQSLPFNAEAIPIWRTCFHCRLFILALAQADYVRNHTDHVWITHGFYDELWWMESDNRSCTNDIMQRMVNRSLAIIPDGYLLKPNHDEPALSGLVSISCVGMFCI